MAEVDGKVVMQSKEGHLYQVAPEDVPTVSRDQGWAVAHDEAVQKRLEERAQYAQYGSTGQQALGAAETAVRTATLGAVPGFGSPEDVQGRSQVLQQESPVANFLSQAVGAAAPAIATGGALGAAGLGEGLVAGAAGAVAEGAVGGTAQEVEAARQENRPVSVGNILMYGVGGELVGRAIPAALRAGVGAARRVAAETGEGVLAGAERRALEASADVADGVPVGPDRDVFLANAHKQVIDQAATRGAKSLDQLSQDVAELSGDGAKRAKVKTLMAKTNPEQREWAASQSQAALDLRNEVRPKKWDPSTPAPEGTDFRAIPELKKPLNDIASTLTQGSKALDDASEAIDWHEAGGRMERDLGKHQETLRKLAADGVEGADELSARLGEHRAQLRIDRESGDLWGEAGDYQRGINQAVADRYAPGAREVKGQFAREMEDGSLQFDPAKLRKHLSADEVGRGVMPEQLEKQLQGAEGLIQTHRTYGTASEEQLSRMQSAVDSVREQLRLSDDVRGARARVKEQGNPYASKSYDPEQAGAVREARDAAAKKAAADELKSQVMSGLLGAAAGAVGHSLGLGAVVTAGTKLLRMSRLLETLGRTGEATVSSAARGAVLGNAGRAMRAVEDLAGRATRGAEEDAVGAGARAAETAAPAVERMRARAGQEGAVVVTGEAHPKIDKLATKLQERVDKVRSLEKRGITDGRVDDARGKVDELLHRLREEHEGRISDVLDGRSPEELGPKARARYDRLKKSQGELEGILAEHGGKMENVDLGGGKTVESYANGDAMKSAEAYLKGRKTIDTEAGAVSTGANLKGLAASPLGLTTAAGAIGLGGYKFAQTHIERFQGDYPDLQTAFDARRKTLDGIMNDPLVLHQVIGQHLGPLSKVHPDAYGQIAARLQSAVQYLHENMPAQMSANMVRPNGIPMSRATARDFAQKYNSALNPASVFEDVKNGTATPTQMRTLQTVHPDLFDSLRLQLVRQVSQNPDSMSTQRKLRMDILFGGDGLAGRAYSWPMAKAISAYRQDRAAQAGSGNQMAASSTAHKSAPSRSISAIKSSVTNA
jgi:hypothetical protein